VAGSNTNHQWSIDVKISDSLAMSHDLNQRTLYIGVQRPDPEMFRSFPLSGFERNESQYTKTGPKLVKSEEGQVAN